MPKKSNDKGSAFERHVAKTLSLWITHGERKDALWRSSQSGGRATRALDKGERLDAQAGDLTATDITGIPLTRRFVFECKDRENMRFFKLIAEHAGPLADFWQKLVAEAKAHEKMPVMIFKEIRRPSMVALTEDGCRHWAGSHRVLLARVTTKPEMYLHKLEDLLEAVNPESLIETR